MALIRPSLAGWQTSLTLAVAVLCLSLADARAAAAEAEAEAETALDRLTIIAPSASGGGYDLTAHAMKEVLELEGIVRSVQITRTPGAGGLIGLAQLIAAHSGNGNVLLIGGMVMVGATASNRATISLRDATPIARLTGDYDVVVVPAGSPYHTLDDLLEAMRVAPGAVRWVGGSAGGADEVLMALLARAAGVDPMLMHYTALPGGNEVIAIIADGKAVAGVSGLSELQPLIKAGELRGLALSSPHPLPGVAIPTFRELGISGLSLINWRGVFAAPDIGNDGRRRLESAIQRMVSSDLWRSALARHHWKDAYLRGPGFADFVASEHGRLVNSPRSATAASDPRMLPSAIARRLQLALVPAILAMALFAALLYQSARGRRRETDLRRALLDLARDSERRATQMRGMLEGVGPLMCRTFDGWQLTSAERCIAQLMLKGLRLKEIARARRTSVRTVRQQAQSIYRKAKLDGRSDLAAYFLEDLLAPLDMRESIGATSERTAVGSTSGAATLVRIA